MTRSRILRGVALVASAAVGIAAADIVIREPSLDREWDEDVRVLTGVDRLPGGVYRLTQVRNWSYSEDSVSTKAYQPIRYDPADVEALWLYEQELGLGGRIAHTFLVFQFPYQYGPTFRWLGLSVETRREVGESYSLVGGVLKRFEVTHIWATEADLVRRRVEYLDYPLTRYRVSVPREYLGPIFTQMVEETAALAETPRWYNTLRTNCTSSLIRYVNQAEPGAIPAHWSSVFTGRADDHLGGLGYVDLGSALGVTKAWLAENSLR
jgi:hypothetical protein